MKTTTEQQIAELAVRFDCLIMAVEGGDEELVIEVLNGIIAAIADKKLFEDFLYPAYQSFCLMIKMDMRLAAKYFATHFDSSTHILLGKDYKSLWLAAMQGNLYLFNLLAAIASKHTQRYSHFKFSDTGKKNILHAVALVNPNLDISTRLIESLPYLVNLTDSDSNTPAHLAVNTSMTLLAQLINNGAKINSANSNNETVLSGLANSSKSKLSDLFRLLDSQSRQKVFDKLICHIKINGNDELRENLSKIHLSFNDHRLYEDLQTSINELRTVIDEVNQYRQQLHTFDQISIYGYLFLIASVVAVSFTASLIFTEFNKYSDFIYLLLVVDLALVAGFVYFGYTKKYPTNPSLHNRLYESVLLPLRDRNIKQPDESPYNSTKTQKLTKLVNELIAGRNLDELDDVLSKLNRKLNNLQTTVKVSLSPHALFSINKSSHIINVSPKTPLLGRLSNGGY